MVSPTNDQGITQSQCRSYMVVLFAFIATFICCGTIYSAPIAMIGFEKVTNETYSVMDQTWLGATMVSTMSFAGVLAVPAMRLIGARGAIIVGGFVAALGPATAVFAKSLPAICLTMGAITGLGVGFAFIPTLLMVEMNFPTSGNRLATSIALSGVGVGIAAYPAGLNLAIDTVDWLYCLLMMSGTLVLVGIMGISMVAPRGQSSKLHLRIFKEEALAKPAFLCVCLAAFIWSFGSSIMYNHIPIFARLSGYSGEQAAIMLSCIGGLSFFSRGMFRILHLGEAFVMDTVTSVFCGLCLTAIFTGLFGDFSVKYSGLLSYSMLFGFYCGFWSNFVNQVNRETIGQELATGGSGFVMIATAFGSFAGPPIAGFLYQETDSYKNIFYIAGSCMMFCSLLLLVVKLGYLPSARIRKEIVKKMTAQKSKPKSSDKTARYRGHSVGEVVGEAVIEDNTGLLTNV